MTIRFRNGSIFNLSRLKASTKVTEALIRELHAAKNYGLQISITKTEVMYQPAPGKPYVEPTITIDDVQLPVTKQFKYLGSVLSNDAQMDEDIKARISKASSAYGRLQERVWKPHGIKLNTKIKEQGNSPHHPAV